MNWKQAGKSQRKSAKPCRPLGFYRLDDGTVLIDGYDVDVTMVIQGRDIDKLCSLLPRDPRMEKLLTAAGLRRTPVVKADEQPAKRRRPRPRSS